MNMTSLWQRYDVYMKTLERPIELGNREHCLLDLSKKHRRDEPWRVSTRVIGDAPLITYYLLPIAYCLLPVPCSLSLNEHQF